VHSGVIQGKSTTTVGARTDLGRRCTSPEFGNSIGCRIILSILGLLLPLLVYDKLDLSGDVVVVGGVVVC